MSSFIGNREVVSNKKIYIAAISAGVYGALLTVGVAIALIMINKSKKKLSNMADTVLIMSGKLTTMSEAVTTLSTNVSTLALSGATMNSGLTTLSNQVSLIPATTSGIMNTNVITIGVSNRACLIKWSKTGNIVTLTIPAVTVTPIGTAVPLLYGFPITESGLLPSAPGVQSPLSGPVSISSTSSGTSQTNTSAYISAGVLSLYKYDNSNASAGYYLSIQQPINVVYMI